MKRSLFRIFSILLSAVLLSTACNPAPDDIIGPDGPDEPDKPKPEVGELVSIAANARVYSLDFASEVAVSLTVDEASAEFNSDAASKECSLSLVGSADDVQPDRLSIRSIDTTETAGLYRVTLAYDSGVKNFSMRVRLRLKTAAKTCYTEAFQVLSADVQQGVVSMRFIPELNPQLSSDIVMSYNAETRTFTGATTSYVSDMNLVATFDCRSIVSVDGVEQQSGVTSNDFSTIKEYVVEADNATLVYRVKVNNFTRLPVIRITTADGRSITSKDVWKQATIEIDGAECFESMAETAIEIRGRGNTTWNWSKKPYAFKFEKRKEVLGMPEHKRWVLLANLMDRTMMRNKVAYHIAEQTSLAWTPRTEFVELYINGKHKGNYLLTEQIRVDENRIDITEMSKNDNSGNAVSGGYLFELDFHYDNKWQWRTSYNLPVSIKYPDEEDLTTQQFEWAKAYVTEADAAIHASTMLDSEKGYKNYFDIQSFVDYWFIYEICLNHEIGNPGSVFMHKDRGGKLVAGPIWDFDWGTFSYNVSTWAPGRLYLQGTLWYGRMFGDPEFKALAKERWTEIYPKLVPIGDYIEEQRSYLAESAIYNFEMWNPAEVGTINGDERISFDEAVDRMKGIYMERIETINSIISKW